MIGFTPKFRLIEASKDGETLTLRMKLGEEEYDLKWKVPNDYKLVDDKGEYHLEDKQGSRCWIKESDISLKLNDVSGGNKFEVKYIGQAYGKDGSRNAIDRLLKHETLQKISVRGVPDGYVLQLVLLEIQSDNRIITLFNPHATNKDDDGSRIQNGLDKLFGTTDSERVSLFEAALIRYFSPQYNIEFKNSFPSTNLKILQDCYGKDFLAVIAEICIDNFPFYLWSESVAPQYYHISKHDIQKNSDRRMFFGMDEED